MSEARVVLHLLSLAVVVVGVNSLATRRRLATTSLGAHAQSPVRRRRTDLERLLLARHRTLQRQREFILSIQHLLIRLLPPLRSRPYRQAPVVYLVLRVGLLNPRGDQVDLLLWLLRCPLTFSFLTIFSNCPSPLPLHGFRNFP